MEQTIVIALSSREAFEKLCKKVSDKVSFNWRYGDTYKTIRRLIRYRPETGHTIENILVDAQEVHIDFPEMGDWVLRVTYDKGYPLYADMEHEFKPLRPEHGPAYHTCDCCGRQIYREMYVIQNLVTGEEVQVGKECAKKYGIKGIEWTNKFMCEINSMFVKDIDYSGEGYANADVSGLNFAFETERVLRAAKYLYDESQGVWKGGYRDEKGRYHHSESNQQLLIYISDNQDGIGNNPKYISGFMEFVRNRYKGNSDYDKIVAGFAKNFYTGKFEVWGAFFAIRDYEQTLHPERVCEKGTMVHFKAKIIDKKSLLGGFGYYMVFTLLTDSGARLERSGALPVINDDNTTEGYAEVKWVKNGTMLLDRVTKNPKKGVKYKEI